MKKKSFIVAGTQRIPVHGNKYNLPTALRLVTAGIFSIPLYYSSILPRSKMEYLFFSSA